MLFPADQDQERWAYCGGLDTTKPALLRQWQEETIDRVVGVLPWPKAYPSLPAGVKKGLQEAQKKQDMENIALYVP
jgi:hypothetical protein